jgi:hypothetical protein
VLLELVYFYGLGALIVFLGAAALGRTSVRSVRDITWEERPATRHAAAEQAAVADPAVAQPAMSDQPTEVVGPTANAAGAPRRSWRDKLRGGGNRLAHR